MIHPTADIDSDAAIGIDVKIWRWVVIRERAQVMDDTIIGDRAYIDHDVKIGRGCKIGNGAQVFYPARVEDSCFIGPGAMLINDSHPRAYGEWTAMGVTLKRGCSIGAGAIIMPGVTIGEGAMVGAGAVVTSDVPKDVTVIGIPGRELK